ncbi:MAG TPA: YfiR family protein [Desulfobulbus sp.]|nr:YfiR family protein [Desulfobulbus sp.]
MFSHCFLRPVLLFCFGLLLVFQPDQVIAGRQAEEAQLKAAYIYNFGKYVTWPAKMATGPVKICLLGRQDPMAGSLGKLAGKTIRDRDVTFDVLDSVSAKTDCEVLFISHSRQEQLAGVLAQLAGHGVLTVSDIQGFAGRGGMIELVKKKNKIRFIINIDSVRRAGLIISSRLLSLATVLSGEQKP